MVTLISYSHCSLDMILTVTFWRVGLLLPFQEVRPQPAAIASEPAVTGNKFDQKCKVAAMI